MQKRAPTLGNILVIILFALSCFGLLMFLWESFGGPLPLKPKGYRFSVAFPRTLALAEESDVRISGVDVGHVVAIKLGEDGRTHATIELSSRYAPIRANMHAILRQKTLLGETYVQLIPQANAGPNLGDGAQLANSQVEQSVTLDDILAAFDPKTRKAFQIWQQAVSEGINGRGEQINAGFAELEPFASQGNKLLTVLNSQEGALREVIHNTGVVFNALASRDHQLEQMIVNGEHTFKAAAAGSHAFAQAFEALPTFEHNSRVALKELDRFAADATPFLKEFQPAERGLSSLLRAARPFAPEFDRFLTSLGPLTSAAKVGLPDLKTALDLTTPVLENTRPVLHNLDPFLQYTGEYVPELQAFFANITAATQSQGFNGSLSGEKEGPKEHLLTTMSVLNPEALALYPNRLGTDRANPYKHIGGLQALSTGLPVYSTSTCANSAPAIDPEAPESETISKSIIEQILAFKVANKPESPNEVAAPPCIPQEPFTFNGQTSQFPHVVYSGK
ncbi:MAG TPA: MlaD family protein [Solirubrobacteraceae bacterium]|nr:MlaD family protein [Solirubrobacteraceae bacterium]